MSSVEEPEVRAATKVSGMTSQLIITNKIKNKAFLLIIGGVAANKRKNGSHQIRVTINNNIVIEKEVSQ